MTVEQTVRACWPGKNYEFYSESHGKPSQSLE